jgi:putative phage-type endonuclease
MTMKTHELIQGSPEWLAYRAQHFNASDAPAMMGCSPYMTRNELLTRMKTGITADVDAATQRRFDDGHRFEELARSLIAEPLLGEDLFPVTGSLGELSASFDGITLDDSTIFEHKTLGDALRYTPWDEGNGDHLPLHYRVQMEQQLLVSGAQRVLFMASKWSNDTLVEKRHCWYVSDPELRAQIVAGWKQFAADLANFVPEAKAAPVVAAPVETLPAVSVKVDGALAIVSNLPDFGAALRTFIDKIPAQPSTDQEFADTEAACKALKKAEEALEAAESNALAQLSDVDTMRRLVADFKALARATRLQREKLVTQRKEAIKGEIVAAGVAALSKHIRELNAALPADYMPAVSADFGGVIKGLRTVDSIRNAVDTELARAKIAASDIANRIHANVKTVRDSGLIVHDMALLVLKAPDDLAAVVAQRQAAEKARQEAERERIRAEEAARLEREAAAKAAAEKAEADRAERERARAAQVEADRIAREQQEAASAARIRDELIEKQMRLLDRAEDAAIVTGLAVVSGDKVFDANDVYETHPSDDGARLTLGQINEMLSPVSITGDGLAMLGFQPVERVKASKLYRACDFDAICRAICNHINAARPVVA